jgi:hypothetical protein
VKHFAILQLHGRSLQHVVIFHQHHFSNLEYETFNTRPWAFHPQTSCRLEQWRLHRNHPINGTKRAKSCPIYSHSPRIRRTALSLRQQHYIGMAVLRCHHSRPTLLVRPGLTGFLCRHNLVTLKRLLWRFLRFQPAKSSHPITVSKT